MPTFEFWIILSFLINAFPIVFIICWASPEQVENGWKVVSLASPGGIGQDIFPAFFFAFVTLFIGVLIDSFRHAIEWTVEWLVERWRGPQIECAFYPRIFIEDVGGLNYPRRLDEKGYLFAQDLLLQKLRRYNNRFYLAEGLSSYALACLFAGLIIVAVKGTGLKDVLKTKTCIPDIKLFLWFGHISTLMAISFSFLWCRDKVLFINRILHTTRFDTWYAGRRLYFAFFYFWYGVNIFLLDHYVEFFAPIKTYHAEFWGGCCLCSTLSFSALWRLGQPT